jgi:hypothetical protein
MTRRALIIWAAVAVLWANLPYLVGYVRSTPQARFGGFFLYEQDGYSYYAKMRQGAQGAWTFHLPYTSEDEYQAGGFVYPFYLALGRLANVGLSYPLLYHGARLLGSLLLLIVLARFIGRFVADARWQLIIWVLLLFSSGWGLLVSYLIDPKYVAYELIAPDAFLFSILYGPPHVIFGYALLLIWIDYTLDSFQADRCRLPRRLLIANLIGGAAALAREAYGPAYAGIFGAYLIALAIQQRRLPWRLAGLVGLSSLTAGAYGVYMLIAYRVIPGFNAWYRQNPFVSPPPLDFLLGFAPLLLLAIFGLARRRRASSPFTPPSLLITRYSLFILAWLIAGPIMAYLPIEISRRLIIGWQIPLGVFAAYGLIELWRRRRGWGLAAAALVVPSTLLIILGGTARVLTPQPPLYITADQQAALAWLGAHTTDRDVVLSDWRFGNLVPIYAEARVFVGHPIETIAFDAKTQIVEAFFAGDAAARRALIDKWRITWIVAEADRMVKDQTPAVDFGSVRIYRAAP